MARPGPHHSFLRALLIHSRARFRHNPFAVNPPTHSTTTVVRGGNDLQLQLLGAVRPHPLTTTETTTHTRTPATASRATHPTTRRPLGRRDAGGIDVIPIRSGGYGALATYTSLWDRCVSDPARAARRARYPSLGILYSRDMLPHPCGDPLFARQRYPPL